MRNRRSRYFFVLNDLIPLAQVPRRDLRTIEEIQNDLWREKEGEELSFSDRTNEKYFNRSSSQFVISICTRRVLPQKKGVKMKQSRKRARDEKKMMESEDSFIVSEEGEEEVPEFLIIEPKYVHCLNARDRRE